MLLKRLFFLAGSVILFVLFLTVYFKFSDYQMEGQFRAERVRLGVEGAILTAPDPASSAPAPSTTSDSGQAPSPAANPSPDSNVIIGPVPPPSSAPSDATTNPSPSPDSAPIQPTAHAPTPDSTPNPDGAPTPSSPSTTPDTNSAPVPPPSSSTMVEPRVTCSPFFQLAAYHPSDDLALQMPMAETTQATATAEPAAPVAGPADKAESTTPPPAQTPAPATVATPADSAPTNSVPLRPAVGEASVIVLLYHQFYPPNSPSRNPWSMNVDEFEREMKYLKDNGYHVVSLADMVRFIKHEISLPPGSVVITIDDGYKSAIVYAAPILKKYGYPWTYYIYPDFITVNEGKGAASWNDLLALQADGVDIESHSMTHPTLTLRRHKFHGTVKDLNPEEYDEFLTTETLGAKTLLEQKMGKKITSFAYPYGAYNKQVEAKAIAAGYESILTVADNPVHSTTPLTSIGRYTITQEVEKNFAAYLRQSALSLTEADPEPGATISNPRPVITAVLGHIGGSALDPTSIETQVRDFGVVKHDFDPATNTVRLYLPRDLISPVVLVNLRVKDSSTGQILVANWHFNYEPVGGAVHAPITAPVTNAPPKSTKP